MIKMKIQNSKLKDGIFLVKIDSKKNPKGDKK